MHLLNSKPQRILTTFVQRNVPFFGYCFHLFFPAPKGYFVKAVVVKSNFYIWSLLSPKGKIREPSKYFWWSHFRLTKFNVFLTLVYILYSIALQLSDVFKSYVSVCARYSKVTSLVSFDYDVGPFQMKKQIIQEVDKNKSEKKKEDEKRDKMNHRKLIFSNLNMTQFKPISGLSQKSCPLCVALH